MVFNVLAFNHDDHTKNFSFIYETGKWKLSPAYDLIFAYDPENYWLKNHNININGKNHHVTKEDILAVGERFGIKKADKIMLNISEIIHNFNDYADKYHYPTAKTETINNIFREIIF